MAKNKNSKPAAPVPARKPSNRKATSNDRAKKPSGTISEARLQWLAAGTVAVLTWLFYKVCLNNQLTNWDDPGYIRDNKLIKDTSAEGLKEIFTTPIMGNYHPLTILSYAIEYSYVRLEPWLYHLDSVLFHILVTVLVYVFVQQLTRKTVAAFITALLFGLHPMHVESVAWLAGRKDVVYGTFYMAACIGHLFYIRNTANKKWLWYGGVILMFVCSLLSKPVAVTLPVTLLAIDYWERKEWNIKILLEKIPLFILSIGFGIRSVIDQQDFGSLGTQNVTYSILERIALGGYAYITYLRNAIFPTGLSNFYPYPPKVDGTLPLPYYLYTLGTLLTLLVLWRFRKNKAVVFGSLFFLINIALLLQFVPVGGAILADRYSYIPYMGLFFIAGWIISKLIETPEKKQIGLITFAVVCAYSLYLGKLTTDRCKDWYDTASLWRDEIQKQPLAPNAFNNLGFHYFNKFNESVNPAERKIYFDSSYMLLNQSIALQSTFANPYVSLGELHRANGQLNIARSYYYKALSLKDKEGSANAYLGLAIIYAMSGNLDSSGICFRNAIEYKPYFPELHSNYGNFFDMSHKPDSALIQYGIAISQNPDMYAPHLNRARLYSRQNKYQDALNDFAIAASLNPDMGEIYYSRSFTYNKMGNKAAALRDVEQAIRLGFPNVDQAYYKMLKGQ